MTKEEIFEFVDNNLEMTVNQRIKLILKDGKMLYGFFKKYTEAEYFSKLKEKSIWDFFETPAQETQSQKATVINGDDIVSLEITEI
jgi:hypothetical protein